MPQNKRGSILLYTLFLSSFLVLFFVSFQGELEQMLEGAKSSEKSIQDISSTRDALVLLQNTPSESGSISTNENLSLVSLIQSGSVFTESLGGESSREYWITSTGGATSFTLSIIGGGPVSYSLAAFNSGSEAAATVVSSGVVTISSSINLSSILNTHILVIDPLGGQVQYTIDKKTSITLPPSISYRLERDINGYKKDEGMETIIHFIQKSRSGFNYQSMGMYLKE